MPEAASPAPTARADAAADARAATAPGAGADESHIRGAGRGIPAPRSPGHRAVSPPSAVAVQRWCPGLVTRSASRASLGSRAAAALCTTSTSLNPPAAAEVAVRIQVNPGQYVPVGRCRSPTPPESAGGRARTGPGWCPPRRSRRRDRCRRAEKTTESAGTAAGDRPPWLLVSVVLTRHPALALPDPHRQNVVAGGQLAVGPRRHRGRLGGHRGDRHRRAGGPGPSDRGRRTGLGPPRAGPPGTGGRATEHRKAVTRLRGGRNAPRLASRGWPLRRCATRDCAAATGPQSHPSNVTAMAAETGTLAHRRIRGTPKERGQRRTRQTPTPNGGIVSWRADWALTAR